MIRRHLKWYVELEVPMVGRLPYAENQSEEWVSIILP